MFKLVSIGILVYVLYKLVFPNNAISGPDKENLSATAEEEVIDIDYEELD